MGLAAVVDVASLLLEFAWCNSIPSRTSYYNDTDIMAKAEACRSDPGGIYVGDVERRWLLILVTMRSIVIVPTINVLGHNRYSCTEDGINPNQDFLTI